MLCSSWLARRDDDSRGPDAAWYLDSAWSAEHAWPHEIIAWPDFGVIDPQALARIGGEIVARIRTGEVVEIGCLGGHGRTGTMLAAVIGLAEGLDAPAALREVRSRYCPHAVETSAQVELLRCVLGP